MRPRWGSAHKTTFKRLSRIPIPVREIKHIFHGACRHERHQCTIAVPNKERAIRKAARACAGILRTKQHSAFVTYPHSGT